MQALFCILFYIELQLHTVCIYVIIMKGNYSIGKDKVAITLLLFRVHIIVANNHVQSLFQLRSMQVIIIQLSSLSFIK
jgi:hypothetical protein